MSNKRERFGEEELETLTSILDKLGHIPISVRSSATNEACVLPGGKGSVHAGENTSFMLPNNHPFQHGWTAKVILNWLKNSGQSMEAEKS